jgi:hypothetical protein
MKLIHALIPLTFVLSGLVFAQDFREVNWGATMAEVRASEAFDLLVEGKNYLMFTGAINGYKVAARYGFLPDDRLYSAGYIFLEEYTNRNTYIEAYEEVSTTLERIYGTPKLSDTYWSDDLYQDDPQDYGMAVAVGHVVYDAGWETETTLIRHTLRGNNYEIDHIVAYGSIELADISQEQEQQEEDDAF